MSTITATSLACELAVASTEISPHVSYGRAHGPQMTAGSLKFGARPNVLVVWMQARACKPPGERDEFKGKMSLSVVSRLTQMLKRSRVPGAMPLTR